MVELQPCLPSGLTQWVAVTADPVKLARESTAAPVTSKPHGERLLEKAGMEPSWDRLDSNSQVREIPGLNERKPS